MSASDLMVSIRARLNEIAAAELLQTQPTADMSIAQVMEYVNDVLMMPDCAGAKVAVSRDATGAEISVKGDLLQASIFKEERRQGSSSRLMIKVTGGVVVELPITTVQELRQAIISICDSNLDYFHRQPGALTTSMTT